MIIGTAGHIDHGKTALVRALTGVDTDRLKEEKARGISIDLGFAYLHAADGTELGFVDVPGHERFIRNMLAGATGIDFVLLVVAADDGVMPQTVEHLAIVDLLGVQQGLVALAKTDLVPQARWDEAAREIKEKLAETRLASAEILPVSAVTGEGGDDLRDKLLAAARRLGERTAKGRFRLAVDRCFTLPGAGTVVTGTVGTGAVAVGDRVMVSPSGLSARVRSIHAQNRPTERGRAGQRCALNLVGDGITKRSIVRGDVVLDPALHAPTGRIDAALQVLASEPTIEQWMPVRLYHAAAEVGARIVLLETAPEPGGGKCYVQLVLERPIAAAAGDRFILRDSSAQRTIGGGRFLDLRAPGRRRRTPERRAQLDACAISEPEHALLALLERAPFYVNLNAFACDRALAASEFDHAIERSGAVRVASEDEVFVLSQATKERFTGSLQAALAAFHAEQPGHLGLGFEPLRPKVEPRLPSKVFSSVLQMLARAGEVVIEGALARLPSHQARLSPADQMLWARITPLLSGATRFRPPRVDEIAAQVVAPGNEVRRLLKSLSRMGQTNEVAADHFFLHDTVAEMVEIAADIAAQNANGQFGAAQFRDRLDNGRKVAIQILEFFDRHGVTQRLGDLRRMNAARLGLFRRPGAAEPQTSALSGRESSPVGRPDFKSGRGRQTVFGGFDSHSLPPHARKAD